MAGIELLNKINNWQEKSDTAIAQELCTQLKQKRLSKNISQNQLAINSGLTRVSISKIENGGNPTLLSVIQYLRGLEDKYIPNISYVSEPIEEYITPLIAAKLAKQRRKRASKSNPIQYPESEW